MKHCSCFCVLSVPFQYRRQAKRRRKATPYLKMHEGGGGGGLRVMDTGIYTAAQKAPTLANTVCSVDSIHVSMCCPLPPLPIHLPFTSNGPQTHRFVPTAVILWHSEQKERIIEAKFLCPITGVALLHSYAVSDNASSLNYNKRPIFYFPYADMSFKMSCLPVLDSFHYCCCSWNLKTATILLGWIQTVTYYVAYFRRRVSWRRHEVRREGGLCVCSS
jgi:hypothetical protein